MSSLVDPTDELEMARCFYGFGRWDAPFWFIGPERGKGPTERADNERRIRAWVALGRPDVCDCRRFHNEIGENRWHRESPSLQRTWRSLMLLLMAAMERPHDSNSLRTYQRTLWGKGEAGETCVIELSGIGARSLATPAEQHRFLHGRIEVIREQLRIRKPAVVVLYGVSHREHWDRIAGADLLCDQVQRCDGTLFVLTPHPLTHGKSDADWVKLGRVLRLELGDASIEQSSFKHVATQLPKVETAKSPHITRAPVGERRYQLIAAPSAVPKGRQRKIVLDILGAAKEPITVAEVADLATRKGLRAVGGVEQSCRCHLHHLELVGIAKVVSPTIEQFAAREGPQIAAVSAPKYPSRTHREEA
jgi:hypothetical protein